MKESIPIDKGPVWKCGFSPDGTRLFACCANGELRQYDVHSRALRRSYRHGTGGGLFSFAASSFNDLVVAGANDGKLLLWDQKTGKLKRQIRQHEKTVFGCCMGRTNTKLLSCSADSMTILWDLETCKYLFTCGGHKGFVYMVDSDSTETSFLTCSFDRTVRVWDHRTGCEVSTLEGHNLDVTCVKYSPDDRYFLSSSSDRTVRIWDSRRMAPVGQWEAHTSAVESCDWEGSSSKFATCSVDGKAKVWDAKSSICVSERDYGCDLECAAFSPTKSVVAISGLDKAVHLWDYPRSGRDLEFVHADVYFTSISVDEFFYCFSHQNAYQQMMAEKDSVLGTKPGDSYVFFPYAEQRVSGKVLRNDVEGKSYVTTWRRAGMPTVAVTSYQFEECPPWGCHATFRIYDVGTHGRSALEWHKDNIWNPLGGFGVELRSLDGTILQRESIGRRELLESLSGAMGFLDSVDMEERPASGGDMPLDTGLHPHSVDDFVVLLGDPSTGGKPTGGLKGQKVDYLQRRFGTRRYYRPSNSALQSEVKALYKEEARNVQVVFQEQKAQLQRQYLEAIQMLEKWRKEDVRDPDLDLESTEKKLQIFRTSITRNLVTGQVVEGGRNQGTPSSIRASNQPVNLPHSAHGRRAADADSAESQSPRAVGSRPMDSKLLESESKAGEGSKLVDDKKMRRQSIGKTQSDLNREGSGTARGVP